MEVLSSGGKLNPGSRLTLFKAIILESCINTSNLLLKEVCFYCKHTPKWSLLDCATTAFKPWESLERPKQPYDVRQKGNSFQI